MATFKPATRLLSRRIITAPTYRAAASISITTTTSSPCFSHPLHSPSQPITITCTPRRYRTDSSSISPANRPVAVPGPVSSSDVSKADSGTPPVQDPNDPGLTSGIPKSTIYTFEDIKALSEEAPSSSPARILIDVREPSELLGTGRIHGSKNLPISTSPDSFFLGGEDFHDRFGWDRPGPETEVVFYCKAGVRSKAAARLAGQAGFGGKVGEYPGSWVEWVARGGEVERVE